MYRNSGRAPTLSKTDRTRSSVESVVSVVVAHLANVVVVAVAVRTDVAAVVVAR